jgi:wobble nucleotide-excising tRNase
MIKKIDIDTFGLYENYKWDAEIGKNETFRRVNIIYGRNYSGKTTLSRVLKSVEDKQLNPKYSSGKFQITFDNNHIINENNLETELQDYKIRVYNSDFVKENLSWLHNDDGTINPFTILGAKNVELDKKIKEIEQKLGSIESEKGLLYNHSIVEKEFIEAKKAYEKSVNDLDDRLRDKAKEIKNNTALYSLPTYQINTIKTDIPKAIKQGELTAEQILNNQKLLKEDQKSEILRLKEAKPGFETFYIQTQELLQKKIKPSQPITDLVNDSLLQEWVRQGIDKHKDKRATCGFCGNPINKDLWEKLDAHFSKESEELRREIKSKIDNLEQAKNNLDNFINLTKEQFYSNLHSDFEAVLKKWSATTKTYSSSIESLTKALNEREKDIFRERELDKIADVSETILETIKEFNALIDLHNKKSETLEIDQNTARRELRLSDVASFIVKIHYEDALGTIQKLESVQKTKRGDLDKLASQINDFDEEKRTLEAQSKDESKGAELVNQHLTHFFGHNELKLIAEGNAPNILFKIVRNDEYASNLSEGECSLISFCYFIAKMEDELKDELNSSKLIIYIDDPISSLDSNHIFFMFSLIESVIAKPKKYCQLFISTHNLDFLKYLKQLTFPKYKEVAEANKEKQDKKHFLVERNGKTKTSLKLAPKYLREYITEFNYLFYQIYSCSKSDAETIEHNYQYNFGNNMRKFLEAYLFYKYPTGKLSFEQRVKKFFAADDVSYNLVSRIINEYSHLGEHFDRGLEPIDVDAMRKISEAVMEKIRAIDKLQFEALLESVENEA